ncbi:MAG: hypothetical protein JWO05_1321 [Gemmatimonadetes bacterium]|nr:hypothetical protein [Gemmatimonadota bacterium]
MLRTAVLEPMLAVHAPAPRLVLDIGGFDGGVSRSFTKPCTTTLVLDLDMIGLRDAVIHGQHAIRASAAELPVGDGRADCALCLDLLSALPASEESVVLREVSRVLSPDGRVFLSTLDPSFRLPFVSIEQMRQRWQVRVGHELPALERMTADAGFAIVARQRWYGALARWSYWLLFYLNIPARPLRVKRWLFRAILRLERVVCLAPRAHLHVLERRRDGAAAAVQ